VGREVAFPNPLSTRLAREARWWLEELTDRVKAYRYPEGPIVGWIVGDTGPAPAPWVGGALDYSPEGKSFLRRYQRVKYAGSSFLPAHGDVQKLDRVEAGEVVRRLAVGWAMEICGGSDSRHTPVIAEVTDQPPGSGGDPTATRTQADGVTLAFAPHSILDYSELRMMGLRAGSLPSPAGVSQLAGSRPLETGSGELDLATAAGVLSMSGVRALDFRSLVSAPLERPRDAPLGPRGELEETGHRLRDLLRLLEAIDHPNLERRVDCVLIANREIARLRESRAGLSSWPPGLASPRALRLLRVDAGPAGGPLEHDPVFDALFDGLRAAGIAFGVAEPSISDESLDSVQVLFLVSFDRMSRPLAQRIFDWVARGGTLVLGPRLPEQDWAGGRLALPPLLQSKEHPGPLRVGALELSDVEIFASGEPIIETPEGAVAAATPMGAGRLVRFGFCLPFDAGARDAENLTALVTRLCHGAGVLPCYPTSDPRVETELHEGAVRRFLFLANPTPDERPITVETGEGEALREVRGRAEHVRPGQQFVVPARSVIVREIVRL
jgi:hypothetical protein